jgi:hypothetical protein
MALVDWGSAQKAVFLRQQAEAQWEGLQRRLLARGVTA